MMGEQRRGDLESHVQKTLKLLKEYEDQLRLSDDPRKKRRLEGEITQLRQLLASYQAELATLDRPGGAGQVPIEFVNRENELHLLHVERLRATRSPYTLISAPAGYGKTYLLQHLLHMVESDETLRQRWCSRYVDCGAGAEDQVGHVVYAITEASLQHGNGLDAATDRVCDCVVQELSAPYPEGRRAVLLIFDAVERLEEAARAWLYALLHELRRRTRPASQDIITVRVIVAGRNAELFWEGYEQAHPLPPAPQRIDLSPFDQHPIQELIWGHTQAARIEVDDQTVIQIASEVRYLGGGHPAVIRGLVDDLAGQSFAVGPIREYFERNRQRLVRTVVSPVAADLLESLAATLDVTTRGAAQALSIFRRVNANTVQALVEAGMLSPEINEIDLLGDMQRAHLLSGPDLREPFYRDHLMRRIWALDMAHRSGESRAQYHRLNKIAIALYRNWIHNLGHGLPDTVLKATQRLLSVVEWLFHALQDEDVDEDELRAELQEHIRVLSEPGQPPSVAALIADEIKRDADVRYLLRRRLGDDGISAVCRWLKAGKDC